MDAMKEVLTKSSCTFSLIGIFRMLLEGFIMNGQSSLSLSHRLVGLRLLVPGIKFSK